MLPKSDCYDILVVGGGFFGMNIAEYFASRGKSVLLCEKYNGCMKRASYVNQARIHNGYHYPRSILTAMRSRLSFPRFVKDYPECVVRDFTKYYGIGKILGKINARQFREFCNRIGAECEEASADVFRLFDSHYIEKVFEVKEFAFDSEILCRIMMKRIAEANVELLLSTSVESFVRDESGFLATLKSDSKQSYKIRTDQIFNCTYSNLNALNAASGIGLIPLKYEMTEMALVEIPESLQGKAFTIMCGPFFSLMPFPSQNLYSLSHVRYTPHYEWKDSKENYISPLQICDADPKRTAYPEMILDASRYLPAVKDCKYKKSIWEVKTLLPASEIDDSRPILFMPDYGVPGYHCIMGGKIDNVYDVIEAIEHYKDHKR